MHARIELTQHDHDLIHHAKRRGPIRLDNGCVCTLVAWKPSRARHRMRIEYRNGKRATVALTRLAEVLPIVEVRDAV